MGFWAGPAASWADFHLARVGSGYTDLHDWLGTAAHWCLCAAMGPGVAAGGLREAWRLRNYVPDRLPGRLCMCLAWCGRVTGEAHDAERPAHVPKNVRICTGQEQKKMESTEIHRVPPQLPTPAADLGRGRECTYRFRHLPNPESWRLSASDNSMVFPLVRPSPRPRSDTHTTLDPRIPIQAGRTLPQSAPRPQTLPPMSRMPYCARAPKRCAAACLVRNIVMGLDGIPRPGFQEERGGTTRSSQSAFFFLRIVEETRHHSREFRMCVGGNSWIQLVALSIARLLRAVLCSMVQPINPVSRAGQCCPAAAA